MLPSILHAIPTPSQVIHPHTMTDPPPNFLVPCTNLSDRGSSTLFHAHFLPSEPRRLTLVSSDHTTLFQPSRVRSLWLTTNSLLSSLRLLSMSLCFSTTP